MRKLKCFIRISNLIFSYFNYQIININLKIIITLVNNDSELRNKWCISNSNFTFSLKK